MRPSAIRREAWRNLASGTTRATMFGALLAICLSILASVDLLQIRSITEAAENYQRVGASISVLTSPGRIDGQACEALVRIPTVRAAGAIRAEEDRISFAALSGAPVPVSTVTPGFPGLLNAETISGHGVILSDQITDILAAMPGDELALVAGTVRVAGTYDYPSDGRTPGYGYMALIPEGDSEPYDECWIDVWPQSDWTQALLYMALRHEPNAETEAPQASVGQLNSTLGVRFVGASSFEERLTRHVPAVAGIIGAALGYLALRIRRLEVASHLHAGVSRGSLCAILALETVTWVLIASILAESAIVVLVASDPGSDRSSLMLIANRSVFLGTVGALAGAFLSWMQTRERHLFRYFKAR